MRAILSRELAVGTCIATALSVPAQAQMPAQPRLGTRGLPVIEQGGLRFKDHDRNGRLEPFEDWRLTPDARARDLASRMTLEEKAGTMMHGTARTLGGFGPPRPGRGAGYDTAANRLLIDSAKVTSLITRLGGAPAFLAAQNDALQEIAERSRLAIPLTVSTDPRHHFQYVFGASVAPGGYSQWPEPLGFAAVADTALVRRFADVARREYRAVGIHMALSPQADLATEPRWSRINGTFGEDAALAGLMVRAYVEGFQGGANGVTREGVATVVKHWVGYGAAREGWDSHNYYGRLAHVDARSLAYHVRPFLAAFAARAAGVMPTYSILEGATLDGRPVERVGAGFNQQLLGDLLRRRHGFRGMILTDWAITNDCNARCRDGAPAGTRPSFADLGMPWGVESLPMRARFAKAVRAGVDQFGGTESADMLVAAVRARELTEARLDSSVVRVLAQKFALGLFEDPYVDPAEATRRVGTMESREQALAAQRRALVLLENRDGILPLRARGAGPLRVYLHGVAREAAARAGWAVVDDPAQADVAVVRLAAPFETPHPGWIFGAMQHEGSLEFRGDDSTYAAFERISAVVPTVATVYLDRPAILTGVRARAKAILGNFGVSDEALVDVLSGRAKPEGRLPFELPSSMAAVRAQRPDLPHDSARPLYRFGYGLRY
jgi:beta-glucosidase